MKLNQLFRPKFILPVLTALAVVLFFGLRYPHHLHYQEQFQLFLFDGDYACDVMGVPGGVADYVGRFVTQFFLFAWPGAVLMGLLMVLVQLLSVKGTGRGWLCSLGIIPVVLLWRTYLNEDTLVGGMVAILLAQLLAWCVTALHANVLRRVLAFLLLPLAYWISGPIFYVFVALVVIEELRRDRSGAAWGVVASLALVAAFLPKMLSGYVAVPPEHMYSGIHYFRNAEVDSRFLWFSAASVVLPGALAALLPRMRETVSRGWVTLALALGLGVGGYYWMVDPAVNGDAEEGMEYDFMARYQQWNNIRIHAEKHRPNNALCATVTNLALGKTGALGSQLFQFQQKGLTGLIPPFNRDAMSPLATSEVFYHLGMINTAQCFVFEAQEAILDYQKSGRCYKRLAETNLICGNYAVARKYLVALQKSLFYSDWANETLTLLGDEEAISRHPEYGPLRACLSKEDRFFSEYEIPQMLSQLCQSNPDNRLAFEYLEAACLLQRDLDGFVQHLSKNPNVSYESLPQVYQEALVLWWSRNNAPADQMPPGINQNNISGIRQFASDLQQNRGDLKRLQKRYGKTYWYYFMSE